MKKIIDKKIVVTTTVIFILGIIAGILFLIFTKGLDKLIIKNEIKEYINILNIGKIQSFSYILSSFKYNMLYISIITISSIVYILFPIVIFVDFYKGLLVGFLISSVVLTYKLKGILYAILLIFPHHILMILLMIIYSSIMFNFSYKLFKGTIKGESINLNLFIKKIGILYISALILCFLISLCEIYINPILVNLI